MRSTMFCPPIGDVPFNLALTNNFAATTNPTANNDTSQGYQVGSRWINTTSDTAFVCVDSTKGAAIWAADGQGSGLSTQGAPASQDTAATLTAAQLLAGIITTAPAGAVNLQLPTGSALDTALPAAGVNSSFDFSIINNAGGANTATLTVNTGSTIVGAAGTAQNVSSRWRARRTAAATWVFYRLS